jgi:hypothetical protein
MSIIRKEQLSNPLSASYAFTASYAENASSTSVNTGSLLITASVNLNTITFTKGNTDQFSITVNTGSSSTINTGSLVTTSSFNAFTASINTFTASYNTGSFSGSFTGSFNGTANTASYYKETDPIFVTKSASLATTGSNSFNGNQSITGSISTTEFFTTTINETSLENFSSTSNYAGTVLSRATIDGGVILYDLVYLDTDGVWYQNNQATAASSLKLGIYLGNDLILTEGHIVIDDTGALGPDVQGPQLSKPIFIRDGAGVYMSINPPSGGYVRILGHIYYQNQNTDPNLYIMRFNPSNDFYLLG